MSERKYCLHCFRVFRTYKSVCDLEACPMRDEGQPAEAEPIVEPEPVEAAEVEDTTDN